jgi:hypothetical protein
MGMLLSCKSESECKNAFNKMMIDKENNFRSNDDLNKKFKSIVKFKIINP